MALLGCALLASLGSASADAAAPLRPNIIFNLVDVRVPSTCAARASSRPHTLTPVCLAQDLGWNDVSWHPEGGNIVKTPYLESLANSGTKLENYYICAPSLATSSATLAAQWLLLPCCPAASPPPSAPQPSLSPEPSHPAVLPLAPRQIASAPPPARPS